MTDFLVAVLFDANVDEEVDVEDVKDNAARMFYLLLLLLLLLLCVCVCVCVASTVDCALLLLCVNDYSFHKFMTWLLGVL